MHCEGATGHEVNSNSYCSLVDVPRGIVCRHKVLTMKNPRVVARIS